MLECTEKTGIPFNGTIIDIESIGDFNSLYKLDSRNYMNIRQVIFGYITGEKLQIFCAASQSEIEELKANTRQLLIDLERPYYAFNCNFESGVFFHHIGLEIAFDGELQNVPFERKKDAILQLKIPNYDDPFFDQGFMCIKAWTTGDYKKAIAHNRACLLKERDILIKRGYQKPEKLRLVKL